MINLPPPRYTEVVTLKVGQTKIFRVIKDKANPNSELSSTITRLRKKYPERQFKTSHSILVHKPNDYQEVLCCTRIEDLH